MAKGDGVFKVRSGKIYVHGTVNGKFYRKSTGLTVTKLNLAWAKKQDPIKYLEQMINEEEKLNGIKTDLENFGRRIIERITKNVSISHARDISSIFENRILPRFKGIKIEDIRPIEIEEYLEELKESCSWTRVKLIKNTFSKIFDYAVENQIITSNPCKMASIQNIDFGWIPKTQAYTTIEVAKILDNAVGWLKVFLELSLKYGLRPGEAMVLKWEDFYLEYGFLKLKRVLNNDQLIREFTKEEIEARGSKINKNHYRTIPLFDSTIQLLKNYSEVRPHKEWLFVTKDGKPFIQSASIIAYHFKPFLKEIGVPYKTLYAIRRSHASIMNFAGEDLEKIQEVMGHTKGSHVTEKHYITEDILSFGDRKKEAVKREALFDIFIDNAREQEKLEN